MTRHHTRLGIVLLLMSAAILACTMSFGTGSDSDGGSGGGAVADGGSGVAPLVRILDPQNGAVVPSNTRVDITVQTDTTATQFQLVVGGQNASIKLMPPDQSGPTSAILSWTPRREGSFTLEVIAYNGTVSGPSASINLQVAGTTNSESTSSGGGGVSGCTGRVLVSQLNFRDGPGTNYSRLGQFSVGETVTITGRNSASTWYKARRSNAQEAWVIKDNSWLQVEGQCSTLPVVG